MPSLSAMESSIELPTGILRNVLITPLKRALPGAQFLMGDSDPQVS